ncbi:hypothetical protein EYR40_003369 [Pleurotus pulmonarius]|nr:hypothetical protein EYR40_003369 [Pleurotus pulmonarius]
MAARQTRSGATFSPWLLNESYIAPVDLRELLDAAAEGGRLEHPEGPVEYAPTQSDPTDLTGCSAGSSEPTDPAHILPEQRLAADKNERPLGPNPTTPNELPCPSCPAPTSCVPDPASRPLETSGSTSTAAHSGSKSKDRYKAKRLDARREKRAKALLLAGNTVKGISRRRIAKSLRVPAAINLGGSSHASTVYIGLRDDVRQPYRSIEELQREGFKSIPWNVQDGFILVDTQGRIFGGGMAPRDPSWAQVASDAADAVEEARNIARFTDGQSQHRRGRFPTLSTGISYGGGQRSPMALRNSTENEAAMSFLLGHPSIKRIAGLQSKMLHTLAPKLGGYYRGTLDSLIESNPTLRRNFPNSDFASMSVNFGPNSISIDHTDFANLATGLCAITALGRFKPDVGGHLILHDLKLIIEFPPGATILIPSALLRHSNVPIQKGESRIQFQRSNSTAPSDYSDTFSAADLPLRGLPGYDWSEASTHRAQPFQDNLRDVAQAERVFQPPLHHGDRSNPRLQGSSEVHSQDPKPRDPQPTRFAADAPPPERLYNHGPFYEGGGAPPRPPAAPGYYGRHPEDTRSLPPAPQPTPAYGWRPEDNTHQPPGYGRARDENEILRMDVYALKVAVYHIQKELSEMRVTCFSVPSRLPSSTPSLAPSDSISRVDLDYGGDDIDAAYTRYQRMQALPNKPRGLPDSVLWTFKGAQAMGPSAGFSATNPHRPSFKKALRDENGNLLDPGMVKLIIRTANNLANRILTLRPVDKQSVDIHHIREYYRTRCPNLWYGAIMLLEEQHREVGLCSAHWKGDHLLGQSIMRVRHLPKEAKQMPPAQAVENNDDSDGWGNEASNIPTTPQRPKRDAEVLTPLQKNNMKRTRIGNPAQKAAPHHRRAAKESSKPTVPIPLVASPVPDTAKSLAFIKVDDDFENLRRTLRGPELNLCSDVVDAGLELLGAMEQSPSHGGRGFPSSETATLLSRVQSADPRCVESEDDLNQSWGHWQWTAGSLTIGTTITSWAAVGNTDTARQLLAAALVTCKAARLLCLEMRPKPQSYLSDSYVDRLISALSEAWKRSGGPPFKGKARLTEHVPAGPKPQMEAQVPEKSTAEDLDEVDNPQDNGTAEVEGSLEIPLAADAEMLAIQTKLATLHVPELRTLAAKKQIANTRTMNKATCALALATLPLASRPTLHDIEGVIAKRPNNKKAKAIASKSAKASVGSGSPTSGSADALESPNDPIETPRPGRIIASATVFQ